MAGVGGQHVALEEPGRMEGQRDRPAGIAIGGREVEVLLGESRIGDGQDDIEAAADAGEGEPALRVGGDGLRPGRRPPGAAGHR